jgi:hypothetical protein
MLLLEKLLWRRRVVVEIVVIVEIVEIVADGRLDAADQANALRKTLQCVRCV